MFVPTLLLAFALSILYSTTGSIHESHTLGTSVHLQHDQMKIAQPPADPDRHGISHNEADTILLILMSGDSQPSRHIHCAESVHTSRSHPSPIVISCLHHILDFPLTRLPFLLHITSGSGNDIVEGYSRKPKLVERHVAVAKSPSALVQPVNNITMLDEIEINSNNPLLDVLSIFMNRIDYFLRSSNGVLLNILGEESDTYVTGLTGNYPLDRDYTIGDGGPETQTFYRRDRTDNPLFWEIRWDWSPRLGAHVNAQFGGRRTRDRRVKFAYKLLPTGRQFFELQGASYLESQEASFDRVVTGLTSLARYFPDTKTWRNGRDMAREDLKQYFRNVAAGADPARY